MKRNPSRHLVHARRSTNVDSLLFPWTAVGRSSHRVLDARPRLRQRAANDEGLSARAWAWIGVGVVAGSAVSALALYGWLFSMFAR
ncbi:MAG: hypothetical protein ACRCV9_04845 [Burkholderiaceae bacterium]